MFREVNSGFIVKRPRWCSVVFSGSRCWDKVEGAIHGLGGSFGKRREGRQDWAGEGVEPLEQVPQSFGQGGGSLGGTSVHLCPMSGGKIRAFLSFQIRMQCDWEPGALCGCPEGLTVPPAAGQQAGSGLPVSTMRVQTSGSWISHAV